MSHHDDTTKALGYTAGWDGSILHVSPRETLVRAYANAVDEAIAKRLMEADARAAEAQARALVAEARARRLSKERALEAQRARKAEERAEMYARIAGEFCARFTNAQTVLFRVKRLASEWAATPQPRTPGHIDGFLWRRNLDHAEALQSAMVLSGHPGQGS